MIQFYALGDRKLATLQSECSTKPCLVTFFPVIGDLMLTFFLVWECQSSFWLGASSYGVGELLLPMFQTGVSLFSFVPESPKKCYGMKEDHIDSMHALTTSRIIWGHAYK